MFFDGTVERIILPNVSGVEFEYNTPFTLSGYIKLSSAKIHNVFNKFSSAGADRGIYVVILNTGLVRFNLSNDGGFKGILIQTTNPVTISNWIRFDFVYKGIPTAANAEIWINGVNQGVTVISDTLGNNTINDPTLSWFLGCSNSLVNGLHGNLHEVKFYNTALTGTDINTDDANLRAFNNGTATAYTPIKNSDLAFRNRTGAEALYGVNNWVFPDEGTGIPSESVLMELVDKSNDIPL